MRVLLLAPQPFYQERGTPMAIASILKVLGSDKSLNLNIDLLCYAEGSELKLPNVNILRIPKLKILQNVRPGPSIKKIFCDTLLLIEVLKIYLKKGSNYYSLTHANEESAFIALLIKKLFKTPYIYDMDSCLSDQLIQKWSKLKFLAKIFSYFEKIIIKSSMEVIAVCPELYEYAEKQGAQNVTLLSDFSNLEDLNLAQKPEKTLRAECNLSEDDKILFYAGNLESYQGIDLLLESFQYIHKEIPSANLVIIGGSSNQINRYKDKITNWESSSRIFFLGSRPVNLLSSYISEANILTSPRTTGGNTPMKVYSYMHANKPLLATNISSHTQVLNSDLCFLTKPNAKDFGNGMKTLINNQELQASLANAAYKKALESYTFEAFRKTLSNCYTQILRKLNK